jgi:hypothetical protein
MLWQEASGKEFEKYVERVLKRKFPVGKGWQIYPKSQLPYKGTSTTVDFELTNKRTGERIIVDAKDKTSLSVADIRQLSAYKRSAKAKKAMVYIASRTHVSDSIDKAAKKSNIEICKTRYPSESSLF